MTEGRERALNTVAGCDDPAKLKRLLANARRLGDAPMWSVRLR